MKKLWNESYFYLGESDYFYCRIMNLPDDFLDILDTVKAKEKYAFAIIFKGKKVKFTKEEFLKLFEDKITNVSQTPESA